MVNKKTVVITAILLCLEYLTAVLKSIKAASFFFQNRFTERAFKLPILRIWRNQGGIAMSFFRVHNGSLSKKSHFKQRVSLSTNMNCLLI